MNFWYRLKASFFEKINKVECNLCVNVGIIFFIEYSVLTWLKIKYNGLLNFWKNILRNCNQNEGCGFLNTSSQNWILFLVLRKIILNIKKFFLNKFKNLKIAFSFN